MSLLALLLLSLGNVADAGWVPARGLGNGGSGGGDTTVPTYEWHGSKRDTSHSHTTYFDTVAASIPSPWVELDISTDSMTGTVAATGLNLEKTSTESGFEGAFRDLPSSTDFIITARFNANMAPFDTGDAMGAFALADDLSAGGVIFAFSNSDHIRYVRWCYDVDTGSGGTGWALISETGQGWAASSSRTVGTDFTGGPLHAALLTYSNGSSTPTAIWDMYHVSESDVSDVTDCFEPVGGRDNHE